MGGGLMQLVAQGAQDVYLTGDPQITFFKAVYQRHTNFAMECIEQVINGTPANSGTSTITISRNGDLIQEIFLEATTKDNQSQNMNNVYPMERMIETCELTIGGQQIDKHYQRWWRLFSELTQDDAKKTQYSKMVNTELDQQTCYLPLIFFFNRNPGLALPLVALQYHEVQLVFTWLSTMSTSVTPSTIKCWSNYYFLDTKERRMFASKNHEYLIEQLQFSGTSVVTSDALKHTRITFNHPVKELVWCFEGHDGCLNMNLWNMTSNVAAEVGADVDYYQTSGRGKSSNAKPEESLGVVRFWDGMYLGEVTDGAMSAFKLQLNGADRFTTQPGKYFNQMQPYYHHTGNPVPGIYSYSFALKPENHQPTGTCNFSRIDNATAVPTMNTTTKTNMAMFATNYNVLRIASGMGAVAYAN